MTETRASSDLTPESPFTEPKFGWSDYLQRHLTSPGVVVSKLHPIMGLRVAALFIDLTQAGYASDTPGEGTVQILSGVRTKAQQEWLYNDICLRQGRCAFVANPDTVHAVDAEGVRRRGSNHMAQRQSWADDTFGVEGYVGYAVDLRNARGSNNAAWAPVHDRLSTYGLDWPLKSGAVERWHIEAFPRSAPGWLPGPWPSRPGVHRPLSAGHRGGDVQILQEQLGVTADGIFGPRTDAAVRAARADMGRIENGVWWEATQEAWEFANAPDTPPAPDPAPIVIPEANQIAALTERLGVLEAENVALKTEADRLTGLNESLSGQVQKLRAQVGAARGPAGELYRVLSEVV